MAPGSAAGAATAGGATVPAPASLWRAWVLAARIPTLPAAVAPVLVGSGAAAAEGGFALPAALGALVVALAIQVGTNLHNDAADFLRGADTPTRQGPPRVTQAGWLPARTVLAGAYTSFGVAGLVGLAFVWRWGWPVLVAGALSILAGVAYTAGPWPLGYHGLGEVFVFLFFGVVAVTGTAFVQLGRISPVALAAAVPVGLLCAAILVANNLRDAATDAAAGKRTLAVRLGTAPTRVLYQVLLLAAVAAPLALRQAGLAGRWFWLPWLALPEFLTLGHLVWRRRDAPALVAVLKRTARLHLVYGALLGASLP
ncbi:MAG: 1,4-dihydroxy-2-naphthoate polyprenyltransferase [Armatimonadota bacterium]|nr:1,4-dihydroxy-2-naphthoate polyprenyltransferase [Armatimonadota bacterium]MDR7485819.1 1,4-dihydroxy-2-naphthoate polyprenyltransferase [Armatimonadota bacterium]MDR7532116.1 1,4-dihydroxy-2-naphthoate polyprenyltransferase [Armatimonadota bacterium]MDR7536705.1 1,4-dihydroxy-2-naphthoate polyprenyltransferase [Armatimonadota bacterium]